MRNDSLMERSKAPDFEHWDSPETHVRWERGLAILAGMVCVVFVFFLLVATLPISPDDDQQPVRGTRQLAQSQPQAGAEEQPAATPTAPPAAAPPADQRLSAVSRAFPNVRRAPSLEGPVVSNLRQGQRVDVVGRSTDNQWLQILNPDNSRERLWVSADMLDVTGDARALPAAQ